MFRSVHFAVIFFIEIVQSQAKNRRENMPILKRFRKSSLLIKKQYEAIRKIYSVYYTLYKVFEIME